MTKPRKALFGLRLRHKFAFSLVIAALLPVIVAYWVGASVVLRGLERGLRAETERQLHVGVNLLLRDIERLGHEAIRLAATPELVSAMPEGPLALTDALGAEVEHLPSALVQIADDRGVIQVQRVVNGGVSRFEGLSVAAESPAVRAGLTYERRVTIVSVGSQLVVRATAPIIDDNFDLRGVVVMSVPLDGLFADRVKASLGADVLIFGGVRPGGAPLVSFLDPLGARVRDIRAGAHVAQIVSSGNTAYENTNVLGHDYALGYAPIFEIEGNIIGIFGVAVDREAVLEARGSATRSLGLGAAGAFVFALGLAGLLSRRITRPLQHLHSGAIAIARGDLDHTISAAEGDEIGDLATAFSHMTTALKENQRRLAARMREIVALHDAGRAVSSVIEPEQVLRKVVDSVARVLHVRICALWLVETSGGKPTGKMILGAARAKRDDMRVIAERAVVEALVEPLVGIAEHVTEARQSLRINAVAQHKEFAGIAHDASIDGSLIAAILERKGVVVGVIIIGRGAEARPFSDADANLLSTFADQAASAIENASLYAEVRKFNEELEAKVALRTVELQAINNELGLTITELQETQAQLILSERLAGLGQLVAGVAHEINSPSAAIRGTADTLAEAVRRLTGRQVELEAMTKDAAEAQALVTYFESVAPGLADKRRVPPAAVRRARRELRERLVVEGVTAETADAVAKSLAELDMDLENTQEMTVFLRGKDAEAGQFIVGYLSDYVYIHRSTLTIQDAIRRIQRIVGSLKGYSHLDQEAARTHADIHEGIENTLVILDHQMARGIRVVRNYAALPGVPIFVDELNQVWTNLIHNALQAIEADGEINIETSAVGAGVSVRIIDNGLGIPDEIMSRIFEPFFTTKPQGEGTGLGLGIVRQIVGKHDGKVSCTSEPGRTCFEVWLPIDFDSIDDAGTAST